MFNLKKKKKNSILLSKVFANFTAILHHTNNMQEFLLLHILVRTWYGLAFKF